MNTLIAVYIAGVIFVMFAIVIAYVLYRKSFRNIAWIARQSGKDVGDVVFVPEKFRVQNRDGLRVIQFLNLRERTNSLGGSFWTKALKPKFAPKLLKFSRDEWDIQDMSRKIQRGIFFYETSAGEFYPMRIVPDGDGFGFSVIDQDNKMFVINETQDINSLTRNRKRDWILSAIAIVALIGIIITFIIGNVYMHEESVAGLSANAQVCSSYAQAIINATQSGQFLDQAVNMVTQPGVGG